MPPDRFLALTPDVRTDDPAVIGPAPGVNGIQLPRIDKRSFCRFVEELNERFSGYSAMEKARVGSWLLFAEQAGFLSRQEIERAWRSPHRYRRLNRLVEKSHKRLTRTLNHVTKQVCPEQSHSLGIEAGLDRESTTLAVRFDRLTYLTVDSLSRLPEPVAACVYGVICLISNNLFPCLLPHEMCSGDCSFQIESAMAEYRQLVEAGVAGDRDRALAYIGEKTESGDFEWLSSFNDIDEGLDLLALAFQGPAGWMKRGAALARHDSVERVARELEKTLRGNPAWARHPWLVYAKEALRSFRSVFPSKKSLRQHRDAEHHLRINEYFDGEFFIGNGMVVSTDSPIERYIAANIDDEAMNAGEYPCAHYRLCDVADSRLRVILERMALGIGWLLRADQVNRQMEAGVET